MPKAKDGHTENLEHESKMEMEAQCEHVNFLERKPV